MKLFSGGCAKLSLICIFAAISIPERSEAQTNLPSGIPTTKGIDEERLGVFSRGTHLPHNVRPDALLQVGKTAIPVDGFIMSAGVMTLEPRQSYVMFTHIRSGAEASVPQKESSFYWSSTAIGLTHPLWSPDGRIVSFREGSRSPERGDASAILLWNLRSNVFESLKADRHSKPIYWPFFQWSPGSRYLSYLRNGSAHGDFDRWATPYELFVYDTKSKVERKLAESTDLFWSWTTRGKILSTSRPQADRWSAHNSLYDHGRAPIYETDVATLRREKLVAEGAFPFASPDNKWIAFFNWKGPLYEPMATSDSPGDAKIGLYLWRRADRKIFFIKSLRLTQEPLIQWSPDSQSLYLIEEQSEPDTHVIYKFEGIRKLSGDSGIDAVSEWHELIPLPNLTGNTAYMLKGTSSDGRVLYLETKSISRLQDEFLQCDYRLWAFDTVGGHLNTVVTDNNTGEVEFWEWRDRSGATPWQNEAKKLEDTLPSWAK